MFKHEKEYLHPVRVDRPNPNYAALLQEQLGGPQGELKSALQYLSQSMHILIIRHSSFCGGGKGAAAVFPTDA